MNRSDFIVTFVLLIVNSAVLLTGCDRTPAGFPDLVPAKVNVVDGTTPLENVQIVLSPVSPIDNLSCGGKTDASGKATIYSSRASYRKAGVPPVEFLVSMHEVIIVPRSKSSEEYSGMSADEQKAFDMEHAKKMLAVQRKIPATLSNTEKTPLRWTVDPAGGELYVDVAEHRNR